MSSCGLYHTYVCPAGQLIHVNGRQTRLNCGSHFVCLLYLSYICISFECPFIGLLDLSSTKMQLSEFLSLLSKQLLPSGEYHIVPQCWQVIRITIKCSQYFSRGGKFRLLFPVGALSLEQCRVHMDMSHRQRASNRNCSADTLPWQLISIFQYQGVCSSNWHADCVWWAC